MNPILKIESLSHSYAIEEETLTDVSFKVMAGDFMSILGPSGSGKSTLLRIIAGLERQSLGRIWINNEIISDENFHMPPEKRNLGLVVQDKSLFPHLDVLSNVAFGIRKDNVKNDIAKELLRAFRIEECEKKFPNELSGGEQQRVALARSLAPEPQILLMDEPFNALDDDLKDDLYRETKNIIKEKEMTVLMVTHDKAESQIFSNKIINLENGKIRE